MRIATYLNTTEQEVLAKKFNIIIGISIGNKYFTRENIRDYLLWAVENTKERVVVLIPDKIHATNYEVKNGYKKERAEKLALKEGEKVCEIVKSILSEISNEKRKIVEILNWEKIETEEYKRMVTILRKEFKENSQFRELLIEIVKENIRSERFTSSDYERLAAYPLEELPMLVCGIEYNGATYDLLPYPGISKIDHLAVGLQDMTIFTELSRKLAAKNKLRIIEAYTD